MATQSHTSLVFVASALLCLALFVDAQGGKGNRGDIHKDGDYEGKREGEKNEWETKSPKRANNTDGQKAAYHEGTREGEKGEWKNRSPEGANNTNGQKKGDREGTREGEKGGWETNNTDGQKRADHEGKRKGEKGGWKNGSPEGVNNTSGQKDGDNDVKREGQKGGKTTNNTDGRQNSDQEGTREGKTGGWKSESPENSDNTDRHQEVDREGTREGERGGYVTASPETADNADRQHEAVHEGAREGERGGSTTESPKRAENTYRQEQADHLESPETAAIKLQMVINNLDYNQLQQDRSAMSQLSRQMQQTIAASAGDGVYAEHVTVELLPGSVIASCEINPPEHVSRSYIKEKLQAATSLPTAVANLVTSSPALEAMTTGTVSVSSPTITVVEGSSSDESGENDSFTTILIAAASASVVCALGMILVAVKLCRKAPTKEGTAQIQANGVTIAVGRPVAASKVATDGIPVAAKVVAGKQVDNDIESNVDFDKFDV